MNKKVSSGSGDSGQALIAPLDYVAKLEKEGKGSALWRPNPGFQTECLLDPAQELLLAGEKGSGKAQPLSSLVLTTYGWVPMGDIKIGDRLPSPSGGKTEVFAIHPQGEKDIWEFEFSDGSKVECCEDHLWYGHWTLQMGKLGRCAKGVNNYKRGDERRAVYSTREIIAKFGKRKGNNFIVPLTLPAEMANTHPPSVDPYVLGVLLGDGSISGNTVGFTNVDPELVDRVRKAYPETVTRQDNLQHYINGDDGKTIRKYLKVWGLMGKHSFDKFIPNLAFNWSIADRFALLQGLMDTDGTVSQKGNDARGVNASFTSTSEALALGVRELARSLGFKAKISKAKIKSAVWPDGTRVPGRPSWDVALQGSNLEEAFFLPRKRERAKKDWNNWEWLSGKRLIGLRPLGKKPAQCITVRKLDGLYITDGYTVTHNSAISRGFLIKGNPDLPLYDVAGRPLMTNHSYIHNGRYVALILRKNQGDLQDFIEHARELYEPLGAKLLRQPFTFKWPSGAIFYTGHLADSSSWMKYLGQELHRIVIEEVVTLENLSDYEALISCNRSAVKGIRPQTMSTMNPRGPGLGWLNDYFRHEPKLAKGSKLSIQVWRPETNSWEMPGGKPVPERVPMKLRVWDEEDSSWLERSRVWYHGKLSDNPHQNTKEYRAGLRMITTPGMREAYAHGSWEATSGQYYTMFRPKGPIGDEPPSARHVRPVTSLPVLMPWEVRAIGADWGYGHDAAAVRMSRREDGRIVIEECHSEPAYSTEMFGRAIGNLIKKDVAECDEPVLVYLSPDCWARESEVESEAKRIARGIEAAIGPDRIWVDGEDDTDRAMLSRGGMVRVVKAYNPRVAGWTYLADLMVWNEALVLEGEQPVQYTQEEAQRIGALKGEREMQRYLEAWKRSLPEERPKFIIAERVVNEKLVQALLKAQHAKEGDGDIDKKHFDGMDLLDACRYGAMGLKSYVAVENAGTERRRHFGELVKVARETGDGQAKEAVRAYQEWMTWQDKKEQQGGGVISLGLPQSRRLKLLR